MEVSKCWKTVELQKNPIKMKNCKTLYEDQTASCLKRNYSTSSQPIPIRQTLLFLTEIYRKTQTFAFKVLQECGSWASRNREVQMSFLTPNRNLFAGIFVKSERFLAVLREYIAFNINWVEIRKMSEVFWVKLYCKMSEFFC